MAEDRRRASARRRRGGRASRIGTRAAESDGPAWSINVTRAGGRRSESHAHGDERAERPSGNVDVGAQRVATSTTSRHGGRAHRCGQVPRCGRGPGGRSRRPALARPGVGQMTAEVQTDERTATAALLRRPTGGHVHARKADSGRSPPGGLYACGGYAPARTRSTIVTISSATSCGWYSITLWPLSVVVRLTVPSASASSVLACSIWASV